MYTNRKRVRDLQGKYPFQCLASYANDCLHFSQEGDNRVMVKLKLVNQRQDKQHYHEPIMANILNTYLAEFPPPLG